MKRLNVRGIAGKVVPVALFVAIFMMFNASLYNITSAAAEEELEAARIAVERAAITFYATEGWYPPDIDVLIAHYGLSIDLDRFVVYYNAVASNIMPQITVLPRQV